MEMLRRHGLFTLVDEGTARVVLMQIESKYHVKNPYHNAMHAADVMHGAFANGMVLGESIVYVGLWNQFVVVVIGHQSNDRRRGTTTLWNTHPVEQGSINRPLVPFNPCPTAV